MGGNHDDAEEWLQELLKYNREAVIELHADCIHLDKSFFEPNASPKQAKSKILASGQASSSSTSNSRHAVPGVIAILYMVYT